MDPQDYIESGILEQYALGELSEVERAEVERQAAAHPLIRQEMNIVLEALAAYATEQAPAAPPAGMRERVLSGWQAAIRARPEAAPAPEAVVRPLVVPAARREPAGFNWLMAASVALLLLSVAANFLFYSRWQNAESNLAIARGNEQRLATTMQAVEKRFGRQTEEVAVLRSDQFRHVALTGTENAPEARARVLFNKATRQVYLDVRRLPTLPEGKQYQLWALYDGKPIDAGTLTAATAQGDSLQLMNNIAQAQAFAMTVEDAGGSPSPTLSTMTVMGKVL